MPLSRHEFFGPDTQLGIWKIEEDAEFFISQLQLSEEEEKLIEDFKNGKRHLHWLASRVLIRTLLNTEEFIELEFSDTGKPVFKKFKPTLSISHSGDYAAVMLSESHEVGVDIELMDNERIIPVAHKFIAEPELSNFIENKRIKEMYVYWCVKEALYKLYSKGELNYAEQLTIDPFNYQEKGHIIGGIHKNGYNENFDVHYECFGNYMLAYVIDTENIIPV